MLARSLVVSFALALVSLGSVPADAATLRTVFVRAEDQTIRVVITNQGTKPIEDLTVTLTNSLGNVVIPSADFCAEGGPLQSHNTCQVAYGQQSGFVTVQAKGKFSASLHLIDNGTSHTVAVIPATK